MSEMFSAPAAASGIDWAALKGSLLLITVHGQEHDVATTFGVAHPVRADVHVLDGDEEGEVYEDTLIFPRALIGQLKSKAGSKVLGRLGQGQAKAGQSPPWLLEAADAADEKLARAALGIKPVRAGKGGDEPPY